MRLYRFTHKRHASHAWDGQGGLKASGRWHTKGKPIIHASEHSALAVLETLVHTTLPELVDFRLCQAEVPDDLVADLRSSDLKAGWDHAIPAPETRAIGDTLLRTNSSLALRVPSSLVPGANVLLNPQHPSFARVKTETAAVEINLPTRL